MCFSKSCCKVNSYPGCISLAEREKMKLNFKYGKISSPALKDEKNNLRDPACLVYNGVVYFFFTIHNLKDNTLCLCVGMTKTNDFIAFDRTRTISPVGYASPGNVIRVKDA